jgi:hypothetical protein
MERAAETVALVAGALLLLAMQMSAGEQGWLSRRWSRASRIASFSKVV